MIKRFKSGIRNSRVRDFLLFLALSFLAWMISRLSETYTQHVSIQMQYVQVPDSLILVSAPSQRLPVRIRANGFHLLRYQLSPKKIEVNLSEIQRSGGRYFVRPDTYRRQVESQLEATVGLLEMPPDTLFVDLQRLHSRTVPVRADIALGLAQNHMLEGEVGVEPTRVHLLGPHEEIDTIAQLWTAPLRLNEVRESFTRDLPLEAAARLPNTRFSAVKVQVSATVFRFSETVVDVPISIVNLPEKAEIRTFPPTVGVLCRGRMETLKDLGPDDFRIEADFTAPDPETGRLGLVLILQPASIQDAVLLENSVEFIVRRE